DQRARPSVEGLLPRGERPRAAGRHGQDPAARRQDALAGHARARAGGPRDREAHRPAGAPGRPQAGPPGPGAPEGAARGRRLTLDTASRHDDGPPRETAMFLLITRYTRPAEEVDRHLEGHIAWIDRNADRVLFTARRVPLTGGVILARRRGARSGPGDDRRGSVRHRRRRGVR